MQPRRRKGVNRHAGGREHEGETIVAKARGVGENPLAGAGSWICATPDDAPRPRRGLQFQRKREDTGRDTNVGMGTANCCWGGVRLLHARNTWNSFAEGCDPPQTATAVRRLIELLEPVAARWHVATRIAKKLVCTHHIR
jgi:hypothetical protein